VVCRGGHPGAVVLVFIGCWVVLVSWCLPTSSLAASTRDPPCEQLLAGLGRVLGHLSWLGCTAAVLRVLGVLVLVGVVAGAGTGVVVPARVRWWWWCCCRWCWCRRCLPVLTSLEVAPVLHPASSCSRAWGGCWVVLHRRRRAW
jgi:hypothetical protein